MYEDSHLEMAYEDRFVVQDDSAWSHEGKDCTDLPDEFFESYCDYCENEGHNYLHCPRRDDEHA